MKYFFHLLFIFCGLLAAAQNQAPQVQITNIQVDTANNSIAIQYNLSDADNDPCQVQAYLSGDSGVSYQVIVSTTGDVGTVQPGTNKSINMNYTIPDISAGANYNKANLFHVKLIASDMKPKDIAAMIAGIDSASVYRHMSYLEGVRHHTNAAKKQEIRDSILDVLSTNNYQVRIQDFMWNNLPGQNFIGRKQGLIDEKKTIIVHGHYDGVVGSPAADDNATAVTGTLIAAEILGNHYFRNSLNMMTFDLEELGLRGAQAFINTGRKNYEEYAAMLNMEMIGYRDTSINTQIVPNGFGQLFPAAVDSIMSNDRRGIFLFNIANANSAPLAAVFDSCARAYVPGIRTVPLVVPGNGTIAPDLRRSDHAIFWDAGYQALMITDGADTRNMNYHQASDTIGTLDFTYLVENIKAVVATAAHLAQPIDADTSLTGYFSLNVDETIGIEEYSSKEIHKIWVSPSGRKLHIQLAHRKSCDRIDGLMISDNLGKKIVFKSYLREGRDITISLPHSLSPGVYVLQSQECNIAQKFVVSEKRH